MKPLTKGNSREGSTDAMAEASQKRVLFIHAGAEVFSTSNVQMQNPLKLNDPKKPVINSGHVRRGMDLSDISRPNF